MAWALGYDETCLVLELCQDISRDKALAWLEDAVAEIRWGSGGKHREPIRDGLIVAVFRHYESRAAESKPLLHDHAVVSIRARRPDGTGTWGNLSADSMLAHIVVADTLYTRCHPAMAGALARTRCTAPDVPHRTDARTADRAP
ncbi:relaxase domain-containing protein [Streptomyces sp. NPDC001920]